MNLLFIRFIIFNFRQFNRMMAVKFVCELVYRHALHRCGKKHAFIRTVSTTLNRLQQTMTTISATTDIGSNATILHLVVYVSFFKLFLNCNFYHLALKFESKVVGM